MQKILAVWILMAVVAGSSSTVISDRLSPEATMLGENELPPMTASMEAVAVEGSKPVRPRMFQSADQIRVYLDTLGKYYTFHNRNRFGKRNMMSEPLTTYQEAYERQPLQEYEIRNFG